MQGAPRSKELRPRICPFACHAAAIAWILGRILTIDPAKEEFVADADANRLRSRAAREWAV
jgi:hypothetical protein